MNINIPGLRNSGEGHWQTLLEERSPEKFYRINQAEWEHPDCHTWINRVEEEMKQFDSQECVLIGHSIGCMTIVHWLKHFQHNIKGAVFVAPTDAEQEGFPNYITGFSPIPLVPLPFPSVVIASDNDHVTTLDRATHFAKYWGSELIVLKDAGHIETISGYGSFPELEEVLQRF